GHAPQSRAEFLRPRRQELRPQFAISAARRLRAGARGIHAHHRQPDPRPLQETIRMTVPLPLLETPAPVVPLAHLDELWFQVGGTLCNLECTHCFISCGPHNHSFGMLTLEAVRAALEESVRLGVKEDYFTGGEPFLTR